MFDHEPQPQDSLLKFMSDMYSAPSTSTLLYTNDEKVLIDIILRQLADLSAADKVRQLFFDTLAAALFAYVFLSFEVGIAEVNSSFKRRYFVFLYICMLHTQSQICARYEFGQYSIRHHFHRVQGGHPHFFSRDELLTLVFLLYQQFFTSVQNYF